jgi:hypothetical protein
LAELGEIINKQKAVCAACGREAALETRVKVVVVAIRTVAIFEGELFIKSMARGEKHA